MIAKSEFGLEVSVFCARYGLSLKELAAEAGVNPNTMQRALADLEREGLLYTNRTSGRYVTEDKKMIDSVRERIAADRIAEFLSGMNQLGFTKEQIIALLDKSSIKEGEKHGENK